MYQLVFLYTSEFILYNILYIIYIYIYIICIPIISEEIVANQSCVMKWIGKLLKKTTWKKTKDLKILKIESSELQVLMEPMVDCTKLCPLQVVAGLGQQCLASTLRGSLSQSFLFFSWHIGMLKSSNKVSFVWIVFFSTNVVTGSGFCWVNLLYLKQDFFFATWGANREPIGCQDKLF